MAGELYMYLPGQLQCPKCGGGATDAGHLTAVGAMPAKPMMSFNLTCAACGTYAGVSTIGASNARPQDAALWGQGL